MSGGNVDWETLKTWDFSDRLKATKSLTPAQIASMPFDDVVKGLLAWRWRYYAMKDYHRYGIEKAEQESTKRIIEARKNQHRIHQMSDLVTDAQARLAEAESRAARGAEVEARLCQQLEFWRSRLLWAERDKAREYEACQESGVASFAYQQASEKAGQIKFLVSKLEQIINAPMTLEAQL